MFILNYPTKNANFIAILPNLRYKDEHIYFKSTKTILIKDNNKIKNENEFILENCSLKNTILYKNINFTFIVIKEENDEGLKITVEYDSMNDLITFYTLEKQKIARYIEGCILGISMEDDTIIDDNIDYFKYYENEIKRINEEHNNNNDNYLVEENNEEVTKEGNKEEIIDENANQYGKDDLYDE